ncbi:H-NS histone family protein [uncultured Tateyamaria sp.]|uniref:H-NS histone family protein n=1 Tax=uncultured Tateyamaria sp. TaxID=455651 RepID=UPI00260EFB1D|nr:H-NS histone family protein [uncultured Tateyamaria sp.]
MAIKLDKMSRKELEALRSDVDKAIIDLRKKEKSDALAAAQKAAAEFGFSLDELTSKRGGKAGAKGASAEPKYMNPENPTQTWTGKGRQPNWFKSALENGKKADDLMI